MLSMIKRRVEASGGKKTLKWQNIRQIIRSTRQNVESKTSRRKKKSLRDRKNNCDDLLPFVMVAVKM